MTTKVCTKCKQVKEFSFFYPRGKSYTSDCRECRSEYSKKRYIDNKESIDANNKEWRENNPERQKELTDAWYERNKEAVSKHRKTRRINEREEVLDRDAKYRENNRETILKYQREWRAANAKHSREYARNYSRRRLQEDPIFKLIKNLRSRVSMAIKASSSKKAYKTKELIGCTVEELWIHLESQFTEGMTRDNYGKWHVDHIKACAKFNLEDPEEQRKCFHWTNLQPLWAIDNIRKGCK